MSFTFGVVGLIRGNLDEISNDHLTDKEGDYDLECFIDVDGETKDVANRTKSIHGKIATQTMEDQEVIDVNDGKISINSQRKPDWDWTKFWLVPGNFIVARSANGEFPFNKLSESTGVEIRRAKFQLGDIMREYSGQWMGGFQDRPEQVRSGTLWGDEIETDIDMGKPFKESNKTQIGPAIEFDGRKIKVRVTQEGFVQVVKPGQYEMEKFLTLIDEMLIKYAYA